MPHRLAAAVCLLVLVWHVPEGLAQPQGTQRPFSTVVEDWNRSFALIGRSLTLGEISAARANMLKTVLASIQNEAKAIKQAAQSELQPLQSQLDALGPPPAEGEPAELPEIAKQRSKIVGDVADYQARIQQADLAVARAKKLIEQISALSLEQTIELLFQAFPVPFAPATVAQAAPEFFKHRVAVGRSPVDWWRSLSEAEQETVIYRALLIVTPALLLAWVIRRALLRFCGRNSVVQNPTYARRLSGAVAVGLADGIVPSLVLAAMIYRARSDASLISGLFAEAFVALCIGLIMIVLAWALPRAVLAPELPAWRLVPVSQDHARIISRWITYLAAVFAADVFVVRSSPNIQPSDEVISLYVFVFAALEATGILLLIRGRLWRWDEEDQAAAASAPEEPAATGRWGFWATLRRVVGLLALAAVASAAFGYAHLSRYVIENLVVSSMAIGILFLIRGLIREAIGGALRSRVIQGTLAIPHRFRTRYKFWLRVALDVVTQLGGLVLLLLIWGVPAEDILAWTQRILQEFKIANVTISLTDIFVAIFVFVATITVTRALQRLLTERVFPETNLDAGVQNSLSSGLGYLGLAVAAMLAISAIGLDLSNVALIAGALSVGIGFGLQAVVSNFVSGLILLIERPIKVGDWIVIGANEGFVKRINVRATEIETFQRASVIVPNSELISGTVTNWTHKDKYGRVEVPVGVAYGSDVEKVMEILNKCLRDHDQILPWPEPSVLFRGFGDSSLDFEARGFIADIEWRAFVASELCVAIERALREADIEIPFPQRDLHIRSVDGLDMAERQRMAAKGGESGAETGPVKPKTRSPAGLGSGAEE